MQDDFLRKCESTSPSTFSAASPIKMQVRTIQISL